MDTRLDVRAWHLISAAVLLAGCGRQASSTSAGETETTPTGESGTETSECSVDADCPPGYSCIEGVCDYDFAPDGGWHGGDCYYEADACPPLQDCIDYDCEPVATPLGFCEPSGAVPIPRTIAGPLLNLSFVDVDGDGVDELALATDTEFHVFESDSDIAAVSAREQGSSVIAGIAAGALDPEAGEDLALASPRQIAIHPSDGLSGFGPPSVGPGLVGTLAGVDASNVDESPGTELVIWGALGAYVLDGDGLLQGLIGVEAGAAVVRGPSVDGAAYVVRSAELLTWYDAARAPLTTAESRSSRDEPLVSVRTQGTWLELDAAHGNNYESWTSLQLRSSTEVLATWGVEGEVSAMAAVDFEGDGRDAVALVFDAQPGVLVVRNLGLGSECVQSIEGPDEPLYLAAGDWDGDGDEELAIGAASGAVLVYDDL